MNLVNLMNLIKEVKNMNREKMIDRLIKVMVDFIVHGHMTIFLEDLLYSGFKGYENYTDKELKEEFENYVKQLERKS